MPCPHKSRRPDAAVPSAGTRFIGRGGAVATGRGDATAVTAGGCGELESARAIVGLRLGLSTVRRGFSLSFRPWSVDSPSAVFVLGLRPAFLLFPWRTYRESVLGAI